MKAGLSTWTGTGLLAMLIAVPLAPHAAQEARWQYLRDGVLHLAPTRQDTLHVGWRPAWQADANEDAVFLQDGRGRLVGERRMGSDEPRGTEQWPLTAAGGHYRLEVPGYSFRAFSVNHAQSTAAVFEPARVHFSAEVPASTVLYFAVPAGARAILNGKYHDGVGRFDATRQSDRRRVELDLGRHREYFRFDAVALPESPRREIWRLEMRGAGKVAFWLDDVPNLFVMRPDELFEPIMQAGSANIEVDPARVVGLPPRLGLAMPYAPVPSAARAPLAVLSMGTASFYSFLDVLSADPGRERIVRASYEGELALASDVTILARSGRRATLDADEPTLRAIDAWIDTMADLGGGTVHYLGLADEPNLNYPDYEAFERYFVKAAKRVRMHPRAEAARVRILAPVSSRFVDGPTREGARERRGLDWARRLLRDHGDLIDAIGWHWWQHRDLLDTRSIRRDVRAAAAVAGSGAQGHPRIPLIISQTNISSGGAVSRFDQDTGFAALWWVSTVINATLDGQLAGLMWFKAADDDQYPKGVFRVRTDGGLERKPVGDAMAFIHGRWGGRVVGLENDSFDVDAVAMAGVQGTTIVGVNKAQRHQHLRIGMRGAPPTAMMRIDTLAFAVEGSTTTSSKCQRLGDVVDLPPKTIFAIEPIVGVSNRGERHEGCSS